MRVMVVDDHATNRELCRFMLAHVADQIDVFANGQGVVEAMQQMDTLPDLILLDVMMPIKDGFTTAQDIRRAFPENYIPIIFLTVLDDHDSFERCLTYGDDFILKPVERNVLIAKVQAHYRTVKMHKEVTEQRDQLQHFREQVQYDYAISESIFSNLMKEMSAQVEHLFGIEYISTPSTIFNGDLIVAASRPYGGAYVMIADATGSGLPAAISTIPATRTFFSTAARGLSLGEMVTELNRSLESFLPTGMMLAASVFEVRANGFEVSWWGGGLPDGYILDDAGRVVKRLVSTHMPLGVLKSNEFESDLQHFKLEPGQRIVGYTDGITEAENALGERFGEERLEALLMRVPQGELIPTLYEEVKLFAKAGSRDDLSILTMVFPITNSSQVQLAQPLLLSNVPVKSEISFPAAVLKEVVVMNEIRNFLKGMVLGGAHLDLLCSILSELFSNAIEHGLLELKSDMKEDPDGFFHYYQMREEKLKSLAEYHWIRLNVDYQPAKGRIEMTLEHSGKGFECQQSSQTDSNVTYGRGILLASELCESLHYSNNGKCVHAVYVFNESHTFPAIG